MIFQTRTAPELTGYFDSTVWNRKVFQICHDQAYARHAVVALGALWKAQDVNQTPPNGLSLSLGGNKEARELYAFALRVRQSHSPYERHIASTGSRSSAQHTHIITAHNMF
jgi:hypothetical protein